MGTTIFGGVFRVVTAIVLWICCYLAPAMAQTDPRPGPVVGVEDSLALARYYATYAILANIAYRPIHPVPNNPWEPGLDSTIGRPGADINLAIIPETGPSGAPAGTHDYPHSYGDVETTTLARRMLRAWHYKFGHDGALCLDSQGYECKNAGVPASGIAYQVWAHTQSSHSCSEVGLAFRGTTGSGADWKANFHPLFSVFTAPNDEYAQLGNNIDAIIRRITRLKCYGASSTQIVSVGDSLGGGLAEFAALASYHSPVRISKVYAFNSSPVAALDLIGSNLRDAETGLTIDRVNQQGQILSTGFFQWLHPQEIKATACNPFVRTVEFDAIPEKALPRYRLISRAREAYDRHDIAKLSAKLVQWSYQYDDNGNPTYAPYAQPPTASADCIPRPRYHEPEAEPEYENEPASAASTSIGWNRFYASADDGRAPVQGHGSPSLPPADMGYRGDGYRPDGSYGPIFAAYSDQSGSRAKLTASHVKATRVHGHAIAALPGHKAKKIRTARS